MFNRPAPAPTLADQAADTATEAITATQRATNRTLDSLNSTVQDLRDQAVPLLNRASETANALLQQGKDAVHDGSHKVRAQARRASECTVGYVKEEPLKAMLIAAAVGAALVVLAQLTSRKE